MKLTTSTGDFGRYIDYIPDRVKAFKDTKFKYINLEQTGPALEYLCDSDDEYKKLTEKFAEAAEFAGVKYVVSHSPCLNAYAKPTEEHYNQVVRAIRRSIEVCHTLDIPRIVVHSCPVSGANEEEFLAKQKKFYSEFFDLMEKYNIWVLTENWDNSGHPYATGKDLRNIVDYIDHPLLGICWDTAHGNISPKASALGQYQNIIDCGDKLKGLHISDNFGDTHHHSWPFAGRINWDSVMQGLVDVNYDGCFTFEASYTLLHESNLPLGGWPYKRNSFEYNGEKVTKLMNPSIELKKKAVDLLYDVGKYILYSYDCFEE